MLSDADYINHMTKHVSDKVFKNVSKTDSSGQDLLLITRRTYYVGKITINYEQKGGCPQVGESLL